ncbi:hypothetical protein B6U81_01255 [Thermoplasmatales archaeon ex4484_30]|nr:MAG: hypothetical protein B6U81_01255 [Thermoplasmatales archaeon ex4484_30]
MLAHIKQKHIREMEFTFPPMSDKKEPPGSNSGSERYGEKGEYCISRSSKPIYYSPVSQAS